MYSMTHAGKLISRKKGRFQIDRSWLFALQHGSMVYNPRDHEWIPNATADPWAYCPGKNPEHEYHVIHTLGWSLQITNITLTFDVASEHMYYGKVRIKGDIERGYCAPNHAIKATVIWEPENHCRIFDVGRSYPRMIKFQKRYFVETLENNETNPVTTTCHTCFLAVFKNTFMMNLHSHVLRLSEKPIYKCNEDRPCYATQYQNIFIQYREGFIFFSGKPSPEFDGVHVTIPEGPPSLTPYTKAGIRDGCVIPHETHIYYKSEKIS